MNTFKIGRKGLSMIKEFEDLMLKPYLCPAGVPTIGYGCTMYENGIPVTMLDKPITTKRATALLLNVLAQYEKAVNVFVQTEITQDQFDALAGFCFNVGVSALKASTLLKKVNFYHNDPAIEFEFLKWCKADGSKNGKDDDGDGEIDEKGEKQVLRGLLRRRQAEAKLYFSR